MAATVIDAWLITLGLDPKDFNAHIAQVMKDQEKLRKEAEHTAQHMKEKGEEASEFYKELLAKAGELFAFLAGGHEMKEFIHEEQEAEIATLRLSKVLGLTVEQLGEWQNAAVLSGGSAGGFNHSIKALGGSLVDIEKGLPRAKRALAVFQAVGIGGQAEILVHRQRRKAQIHAVDQADEIAEEDERQQPFRHLQYGLTFQRIGHFTVPPLLPSGQA